MLAKTAPVLRPCSLFVMRAGSPLPRRRFRPCRRGASPHARIALQRVFVGAHEDSSNLVPVTPINIPSLSFCCGDFSKMGVAEVSELTGGAERIPKEAKKILYELASKWSNVADSRALEVVQLEGAMTNAVYQVNWPTMSKDGVSQKVLVRIYGEGVDAFFDREGEIRTFECMSRHGQGPLLLGRFANGRVEEFINARTLSAADLRDPNVSSLIASKLKEFHDLSMPGPRKVSLWERLRNWLKGAIRLCSPEEIEEFQLNKLADEIKMLEKILSAEDQSIGFCHNDLQYGNIMMDEEFKQMTIIDYEYASFNPVAYDLANHFCEMAADYHTQTPHILDFNKYPDVEERKRFVQTYLTSSGDKLIEAEVETMLQLIEKYALASHLLWGLWGIISERLNEIDFEYMEYARQRFQRYWLVKPEVLGSN
ncbi:probable choline kinase 2 [Zingiber officinale]|uniref:probable choline kinase 2 n=1 Tax=Zingiber officinale TaxID=94328 RepID=UPI001C4B29A6|nr:probable choline kinase 2 [Zingiber officinale]